MFLMSSSPTVSATVSGPLTPTSITASGFPSGKNKFNNKTVWRPSEMNDVLIPRKGDLAGDYL